MLCLICRQAKTVNRLTPVTLERGEMRLLFNNVPARVCPSCGEAYVDEDVAVQLLRDAQEVTRTGMPDVILEYKT